MTARYLAAGSLVLYHGGRWQGPAAIMEHRKGQAEHGPGIYLTTSWETANRYAKGGGSVYQVTMRRPSGWAERVRIPEADVLAFISKTFGKGKKAASLREWIGRVVARSGDKVLASSIIAAFVHNDVASGKTGPSLAQFLVDHGVEASLVSQDAEDWVVVFDPKLVESVVKVPSSEVSADGFVFTYPKVT